MGVFVPEGRLPGDHHLRAQIVNDRIDDVAMMQMVDAWRGVEWCVVEECALEETEDAKGEASSQRERLQRDLEEHGDGVLGVGLD